ncbi:uncharacterized protein LOC120916855 [Rana temporaria]|uniref:uncharacterized protein LOC120916855 n=1 Tax=Rana temporaria TaxID=8407 RepID=UPI001AADA8F5|nr:uncharacterized protein LOC120916855 [Rana temporaria]
MEGTLDTTPVLCQSGFSAGSVIMKRYLLHQKLGSGSFATTYLVTDSRDADTQKVIKRIPCNSMKADATLPSAREAKLLGSLRHPFIVRFYASFLEKEDFCIVTEYCEGGDLDCHLHQLRDGGLAMAEGHVMEWFIQLLLGVTYLHERLVLHRDLKTKNIFLKNGTLKIGDFGVSRVLVSSDLATTITGTASYMSPEIFTRNGYNSKSDIWSLGCILYELCTFRHVYDCPRWIRLVSMIVNDPCPTLPPRYSTELNDILQRMLSKDPELRPSAKDILNFPYVADRAKVLEEWLQEVLSEDRRVSVEDDVTRIAAAMQEKLHVDSLRVMRVVQEMPARQRRRIRQEERSETSMGKLKRAAERVYQENHQKLEDDGKYQVLKNAWMENEARPADEEHKALVSIYLEALVCIYLEVLVGIYLEVLVGIYLEALVGIYLEALVGIYLEALVGIYLEALVGIYLEALVGIYLEALVSIYLEVIVSIYLEALGELQWSTPSLNLTLTEHLWEELEWSTPRLDLNPTEHLWEELEWSTLRLDLNPTEHLWEELEWSTPRLDLNPTEHLWEELEWSTLRLDLNPTEHLWEELEWSTPRLDLNPTEHLWEELEWSTLRLDLNPTEHLWKELEWSTLRLDLNPTEHLWEELEQEEESEEEEESDVGSVLTLSLPLSEQQSNTLSAYRSCLRRFLHSSMESVQDTISLDSEEVTPTVCNEEEIAFLKQDCIRLLGEDGFWEVYNYLRQVYNQQDPETSDLEEKDPETPDLEEKDPETPDLEEKDPETPDLEEKTLCEPQVMKLHPHLCYKVQQLLFLEERMEEEPQNPHLSWI